MFTPGLAGTFIRWSALRAVFHRGWWLVTSLYLVVVADLSASQLLFYGAVLALTTIVAEVPTGVLADTVSRKWSIVVAHLCRGAGMVLMGLTTDFSLILVSQFFWALGWTFSSGADVAWITDELDEPDRISRVLMQRARWDQVGAAAGLLGFGGLAWLTDLATAIVAAGLGTIVLGTHVALRFPERNFTPHREARVAASVTILRGGFTLARRDRQIITVLAATLLVNAATEVGFLFPKQLVALGLPEDPDPIVWLTLLGLGALGVGAIALRLVETRIDDIEAARRAYAVTSFVGATGLMVLGYAPGSTVGMAGILLVTGITEPVTRAVSVIWVNQRATSKARATVQSFLSQAEAFGEIGAGALLGALAVAVDMPLILTLSAALLIWASVLVARSPTRSDARHTGSESHRHL